MATGFFEIGGFVELGDSWKSVGKIRILIGGDTGRTTARAVEAAFDDSFDEERLRHDPFLAGSADVIQALRSEQIEVRVYTKRKFHAKAYLAHRSDGPIDLTALVGSSNLTRPGLQQNVELNVHLDADDGSEDDEESTVEQLADWFESYWVDAQPIKDAVLEIITRQTRETTPLEIYGRSLQVLTRDVHSSEEWEETESTIFPGLAPYQKEAYRGLRQMARQWKGGFLTDGVGLGKTFVGLMLAEYFAVKERLNVLICATKTGQQLVWEPEIKKRLPELVGPFSRVMVTAHTDFSKADAAEVTEQLAARVDVVIIDEAHHFRNRGRPGDEEEGVNPSRWWRLQELCRGKQVFLLTATPINNSLFDLLHQAELFTGMDDRYFQSIGLGNVRDYLSRLQKEFRERHEEAEVSGGKVDLTDFEEMLRNDDFLDAVIYQNSRKYAVESSQKAGEDVLFPEMQPPRAVDYNFGPGYRALLEHIEEKFEKGNPLFVLPMYYPLAFSRDEEVDAKAENRQKQVVALIRTVFLKRFESSIAAFAGSCLDLTTKIVDWVTLNAGDDSEVLERIKAWKDENAERRKEIHDRYRPVADYADDADFSDLTDEELDELENHLDPEEYDVPAMIERAFDDLDQMTMFLGHIEEVGAGTDDKYDQLRHLLCSGETDEVFLDVFRDQKVLVFTEFADTASYLHSRLKADGVTDLDWLDGSRSADRKAIIRRFAPYYNKDEQGQLFTGGPRVLISTDVLSEGVNLQDAAIIINYDLHWTPVRLMQRIGRVDRRLNVELEEELLAETPSAAAVRGRVYIRNFLPPAELERLLRLMRRVESRVTLISKTLGIPGGKLLTEDDMLDDTKVFQAFRDEYQGSLSPVEQLRLRYLALLEDNPGLEHALNALPMAVGSARAGDRSALFACRLFPSLVKGEDGQPDKWTLDVPRPRWTLDEEGEEALTALLEIDELIASDSTTRTAPFTDTGALRKRLHDLQREATAGYRKEVQLPLDAPDPEIICWMELQS